MSSHHAVCNTPSNTVEDQYHDVRIVAVFVILISSGIGAYLPIVTGKVERFRIPPLLFDAMKFFGSGVVISTAFIHLLAPGLAKLSSPCLGHIWTTWPFGLTFTMISILLMFLGDIIALRIGAVKASKTEHSDLFQVNHRIARRVSQRELKQADLIDQDYATTSAFDIATVSPAGSVESQLKPQDNMVAREEKKKAEASQIIGVMVLEFGVILHSFIVGLTLGTSGNGQFDSLFIVFVFHQFFEGLGMGARLYDVPVPKKSLLPWVGAFVFMLTTPVGIAVGIGVHHSFNGKGIKEALSIGILDTIASGILLYSSLIELLARDFIFNPKLMTMPIWRVFYNIGWLYLGVTVMTLTRYFAGLSH